jgi:hypothetical protein
MSKRLPIVLLLAALGLAAAVLPGVASAANRGDPAQAGCDAATPAVKDLTAALDGVTAALTDPAKLQTKLGDVYNAILAAQKAECLPALPSTPPTPPAVPHGYAADACLAPTVNLLSAVLGGASATLVTPPDTTAVTAATTKLADAVTAINKAKCLPVSLPVPGVPALPEPPAPPVPPAPPFYSGSL